MVMVMKVRTLLLGAVATLALSTTANAYERDGWYFGLEGGAVWIQDAKVVAVFDPDAAGPNATLTTKMQFDNGWAGLGTIGHHFSNNWRWEVEVGYRTNDSSNTAFNVNEWSGMLNVLYDIPLGQSLWFSLGAGAGADNFQVEASSINFEDRSWNFAYQGIAGLTFAVSDRIDLFANYRYLRVQSPDLSSRTTGPAGLETLAFDDVTKHTATIGLRYNFGSRAEPPPVVAPPPPPPPMETPKAPKEFIVFFGHNKSNLTPEAMDVVKQAAAAAKEYGSSTITVVGHADKSGSPKYNQALSMRRASAVKGALVSQGVADGSISTSAKGESEPMVQTDDGVREPQNRRVHINL